MNTYIEIIHYGTGSVVKRLDVTNHSEHNRDKIDNGMNRNLNHEDFYTCEAESEEPLPVGDFKIAESTEGQP